MTDTTFNPSLFTADDAWTRRYQQKYASRFRAEQTVLDIGCGTGVFLSLLKERGVIGIGIDTSDAMLTICRDKGLSVEHADAGIFLSGNRPQFDGIFCSHIVEHFEPAALLALFEKMYAALKPDGLLIIITPCFKNIEVLSETFWLDATHVRPYPATLLTAMLQHCGFSVLEAGIDKETNKTIPKRNPLATLRYIINKIRFGEYYGKGDSFVVAKKG